MSGTTWAKKWRILVYLQIYWTDFQNLFTIIIKGLYEQMMDLYLIFQYVKGCCHGNQIMLQKRYQRRLDKWLCYG